jgi:hypothetical protein
MNMSKNNSNNRPLKTRTIVVLSDGETWNTVTGCSLVVITEDQFDDLCHDRIDAGDLTPLAEIGLRDFTPPQDIDDEILDDSRQFDDTDTEEDN